MNIIEVKQVASINWFINKLGFIVNGTVIVFVKQEKT